MDAITYSTARANLASTMDLVCEDHAPMIVGKPEPLKHALAGFWSRRLTDKHRTVYRVKDDELQLAQLRFHY